MTEQHEDTSGEVVREEIGPSAPDVRHRFRPRLWIDIGGFAWSGKALAGAPGEHSDLLRVEYVRADIADRTREALADLLAALDARNVTSMSGAKWEETAISLRAAEAAARAVLAETEAKP